MNSIVIRNAVNNAFNKQMYTFTRNCLEKMESMGHKFTDVLRNQLDNIVDDKQFKNDN